MKRAVVLIVIASLLAACDTSDSKKPLSVKGEKVYTMHGKIVSRDPSDNTVKLDHKEIPGFMDAMVMDYSVRGAKVKDLPPDGTAVTARLHSVDDSFWLTDVKKTP